MLILTSINKGALLIASTIEGLLVGHIGDQGGKANAARLTEFNPHGVFDPAETRGAAGSLSSLEFNEIKNLSERFFFVIALDQKGSKLFDTPQIATALIAEDISDHGSDPIFLERLYRASEVEIVGITNENLSPILEKILASRQTPLKRLSVVFSSEQIARLLPDADGTDVAQTLRRSAGLKTLQHLRNFFEGIKVERFDILESPHPLPFVGLRTKEVGISSLLRIGLGLPNKRNRYRPYFDVPAGTLHDSINMTFNFILSKSRKVDVKFLVGKKVTKDGRDSFSPFGLRNRTELRINTPPLFEANVLVVLVRKLEHGSKLCLQKRTNFNSDDAPDKYSNLTARVTESDLYFDAKDFIGSDPGLESDVAYDNYLRKNISPGAVPSPEFPPEIYIQAAVRECHAGLGILVKKENLLRRGQYFYELPAEEPVKVLRYFEIYSLEIPALEYKTIGENRPHASLEYTTKDDLIKKSKANQLNGFLQDHLEDIFIPIFKTLRLDSFYE